MSKNGIRSRTRSQRSGCDFIVRSKSNFHETKTAFQGFCDKTWSDKTCAYCERDNPVITSTWIKYVSHFRHKAGLMVQFHSRSLSLNCFKGLFTLSFWTFLLIKCFLSAQTLRMWIKPILQSQKELWKFKHLSKRAWGWRMLEARDTKNRRQKCRYLVVMSAVKQRRQWIFIKRIKSFKRFFPIVGRKRKQN